MRKEIEAYFLGAMGDATYSRLHRTWRFSQSNREWLLKLKSMLQQIGYRSWLYREGKNRQLHVLETTAKLLSDNTKPLMPMTKNEKIAFVQGFFDAEGGVPQNSKARFMSNFRKRVLVRLKMYTMFSKRSG